MPGLLAIAMAIATPRDCLPGTEQEPPICPLHLPAIRAIVIDRSGARAAGWQGGVPTCAAFRPTVAQLRRYFAAAGATDAASAADATIDRSPCYASGAIRFADGRVARWRIESLRAGMLAMPDRAPQLLYCRACRFEPFDR